MYERKRDKQVFYVIPVESILGKLPVVPIGDTGTIPFAMRQNARDFVDSAFDTKEGSGDGSQQPVDSDRDLTPTVTTGQHGACEPEYIIRVHGISC